MMSEEDKKALLEFDDYFPYGIYVVPSKPNQPDIRIRDAYEKVKQLGRALTRKEMKEFEIPSTTD